jgi:type I restriction enzyme S subunit
VTRTDWFGDLPACWTRAIVGYYFDVGLGKMLNAAKKDEGGVPAPYLAAGSIQPEHLALDDPKTMSFTSDELTRYDLRKDDIVVVEGGAGYGRSHLLTADMPGWGYQNHVARIRRAGAVRPGYLLYCLKACLASGYIEANNRTATLPSLSRDVLRALPIPIPSSDEQLAIADFLDWETARIDTLIEEQQRLIDLLRERRQSAITNYVAGGFHSDLRDTGSQWYPRLPGAWSLGRVKSFTIRVTDGAHISPETENGVYDFVSTRDVKAGVIDYAGSLKTSPESYGYMVRTGCRPERGDVLFSKDGTVGETAIVREAREFVVASSLVIISPDQARLVPEFLTYALSSKAAREQATSMMRGAGLPRISVANLARLEVPLPPVDEQRRIVALLDTQTSEIDALIAETATFIELARERRSALITAAVTGQIDVRAEVA